MSAKKDASRRNVAAMARQMADKAMTTLDKAMDDPDPRVRVDAAKHVLDRAIGKPIAMTADVTDRLDDLTDDELDGAIAAIRSQLAKAAEADGTGEDPPTVTH